MSSEKTSEGEAGLSEAWGEVSVPFVSNSVFYGEAVNLRHGRYARFFPLDTTSSGRNGDSDLNAVAAAMKAVAKKEADLDWVESIQLGLIEERGSAPLRLAIVVQGDASGSDSVQKKRNRILVADARDAFDRVNNSDAFDTLEGTEVQNAIIRSLDSKRSTVNDKQVSLLQPRTENEVGKVDSRKTLEKIDRWLPKKRKPIGKKSWKYEGQIMIDSVNDVTGTVIVSFVERDEPRKHLSSIEVKNDFSQNRLRYLIAQLKRVPLRVEMTVSPQAKNTATARIKRIYTETIDAHVEQYLANSDKAGEDWDGHSAPAGFEEQSANDN